MQKAGGGRIVNISSLAALVGLENLASYSAAKGGVIGLTQQAAFTYAPDNILINAIAPGTIDTPILADITADDAGAERELALIKRLGRPEEIAGMMAFCFSDDGTFSTGSHVPRGRRLVGQRPQLLSELAARPGRAAHSAEPDPSTWCIRPIRSYSLQCSTMRPSRSRSRFTPVRVTDLPVGATPPNSPTCVPVIVHRNATRSSSTVMSAIAMRIAKLLASSCMRRLNPSGPGTSAVNGA